MACDGVPVAKAPHTERFKSLTELFQRKFEELPSFFVRVPGRVNLIGEHVDYCGYPVLPMALEQDVIIAVRGTQDPILRLVNKDCTFSEYEGNITEFKRKEGKPDWHSYILCGVIGASQIAFANKEPRGLMLAVCGKIPIAAGLSSSSALVCASALALLHENQISLSKMEMALLCARSEHLIGTEGGGMDQAIAFLAKEGFAQFISWNPLTATPVLLPDDAVFVVAHSLVEANKGAAQDFNDRVKSCRIAAQMIARSQGLDEEASNSKLTLHAVQQRLNISLYEMKELVKKLPQNVGRLKIKDRALHVIDEAIRVEEFKKICDDVYRDECWEKKLGGYMRASHKSLTELYECSHPSLNELIRLSDEFGVNARLTGAGWGGCIVALCSKNKVSAYVDMLVKNYYMPNPAVTEKNISDLVFVTAPKQGAFIYNSH